MNQRGDIVYVEIPFYDRPGSKERPVVVIQCDRNNRRLLSTVVAGITGNTNRLGKEPTQFLIDPGTSDGVSSGLAHPSSVKCENLYTVSQTRIRRTVGHLSDNLELKLADCLKAALELT